MNERLLAPPASRHCLDLEQLSTLAQAGAQTPELGAALMQARQQADRRLAEAFAGGAPVRELVQARAWVVEQLLLTAWQAGGADRGGAVLLAVGGFGRGELHPYSDTDVLVLLPDALDRDSGLGEALETFIQLLWDAGLKPGHGVRTLDECVAQAEADVQVLTNLMEARRVDGAPELVQQLRSRIAPDRLWPPDRFFAAKVEEQRRRHAQFEDTVYSLEPDLKNGPGGLRDIQVISWVAQRKFGSSTLHGLVEHGFLTEQEHDRLVAARDELWRIRWALHQVAGRAEERLLFDYQRALARAFGCTGDDNAAVEAFMQSFYRTVIGVERLNELALQLFEEELLAGRSHLPSGDIDRHFRLRHGYLEVRDPQAFVRRPSLLLEIFLVLADHPEARGVRASTIRLIREHLYLIDEAFRQVPGHLGILLELLRRPNRVYAALERMNRYGILAALLPAFARVTGRMQFDLFHAYTVDQHILFVIRNLRRIARGRQPEAFGRASRVFERIARPEVLYLAALFHDIAKGRGGDHSELGEQEARDFFARLDLSAEDRDLVCWLVREHLLMSQTAQRRDITDPEVVARFADAVGTRRRLDHLYVLTVADIAATSPRLWNSWKDSLLHELYEVTARYLEDSGTVHADWKSRADAVAADATARLRDQGFSAERIAAVLSGLEAQALARLDPDQLAWTVGCLLGSTEAAQIRARNLPEKGITEVFIHVEDFDGLFAIAAREFDRMELNVLGARVATTRDRHSWNLYQLMDARGEMLNEADRERLVADLARQLARRDIRPLPVRPLPRRLRPFMRPAEIGFETEGACTRMDLVTTDRPGLLSAIAEGLLSCGMRVHDARIATFGQRVEDSFLITDREGRALDPAQQDVLLAELRTRLDPPGASVDA